MTVLVQSIRFNQVIAGAELDGFLQEGSTLTRKHGLVDNDTTFNQENITSNTTVLLGTANGHEIAGEELVAGDFLPLALAVHPDIIRLDAHSTELVQGPLALPHNGALESNEHEQREERVVPVFIEHPQSNTEDLEDEERCNGVLLEELEEVREREYRRCYRHSDVGCGQFRPST